MDYRKTPDITERSDGEDSRRRLEKLIDRLPADHLRDVENFVFELLEAIENPTDERDDLAEELRRLSNQEDSMKVPGRTKYLQ